MKQKNLSIPITAGLNTLPNRLGIPDNAKVLGIAVNANDADPNTGLPQLSDFKKAFLKLRVEGYDYLENLAIENLREVQNANSVGKPYYPLDLPVGNINLESSSVLWQDTTIPTGEALNLIVYYV